MYTTYVVYYAAYLNSIGLSYATHITEHWWKVNFMAQTFYTAQFGIALKINPGDQGNNTLKNNASV